MVKLLTKSYMGVLQNMNTFEVSVVFATITTFAKLINLMIGQDIAFSLGIPLAKVLTKSMILKLMRFLLIAM